MSSIGIHNSLLSSVEIQNPVEALDQNVAQTPVENISGANISGAMGPVRGFATVQGAAEQNISTLTGADVKAQVQEGCGGRIARWFKEGLLNIHGTAGLSKTIEITLPNNIYFSYKDTELASMITCLPRMQRAEARSHFAENLSARMLRGQALTQNILAEGHGLEIAESQHPSQDVADIMLFLDGKSRAAKNGFSEGAFSLEDTKGHLYNFLNANPEKYLRSSSHMRTAQNLTIGTPPQTHTNVHRGIDLPKGPNGLPTGKHTLLFCVIPEVAGFSTRRIFLKPESHGCKMSTLSGAARRAGLGISRAELGIRRAEQSETERPVHFWTDLGSMFKHTVSFASSRGQGDAAGSRKERIPTAVKDAFTAFTNTVGTLFPNVSVPLLTMNNPADTSQGVRTIFANLRTALENLPAGKERNDFASHASQFAYTIAPLLTETTHMHERIGNEVLYNESELAAPITADSIENCTSKDMGDMAQGAFFSGFTSDQRLSIGSIPAVLRAHAASGIPEVRDAIKALGAENLDRNDRTAVQAALNKVQRSIDTAMDGIKDVVGIRKIDIVTYRNAFTAFAVQACDRDARNLLISMSSRDFSKAQRAQLDSIPSTLQFNALLALPAVVESLTNLAEAGADNANGARVSGAINGLYDAIAAPLQGIDDSRDTIKHFTIGLTALASSSINNIKTAHDLLSTPAAQLQRAEMHMITEALVIGSRNMTSFTENAGIIGRLPDFLPHVMHGIETITNQQAVEPIVPQVVELSEPVVLQEAVDPQALFSSSAEAKFNTLIEENEGALALNSNDIAGQFVNEYITGSGKLYIIDANSDRQLQGSETEIMDSLKSSAIRAAVTRLATQATLPIFEEATQSLRSSQYGLTLNPNTTDGFRQQCSYNPSTQVFESMITVTPESFSYVDGRPVQKLNPDAELEYIFSCTLVEDGGNVQVRNTKTEIVSNWRFAQ